MCVDLQRVVRRSSQSDAVSRLESLSLEVAFFFFLTSLNLLRF